MQGYTSTADRRTMGLQPVIHLITRHYVSTMIQQRIMSRAIGPTWKHTHSQLVCAYKMYRETILVPVT
jgi:hypothetical protein